LATCGVAQASEYDFAFLWHLKQCVQSLPFVGVIVKPCFTALVGLSLNIGASVGGLVKGWAGHCGD
jgi:hypothetical protein